MTQNFFYKYHLAALVRDFPDPDFLRSGDGDLRVFAVFGGDPGVFGFRPYLGGGPVKKVSDILFDQVMPTNIEINKGR